MGTRRSQLEPGKLVLLPALLILLLYGGARNPYCSGFADSTTDRSSLIDFKKSVTKDPNGALRSWNDSVNHCMWSGVSCSKWHSGRVMVLDLSNQSLAGQITPSLGNLTFLRDLSLPSNRFSGQLPPLNRLRKLEVLHLGDNLLQGNIADALIAVANCSKLKYLGLYTNMFVGSIPRNMDAPSNLGSLNLFNNSLTGSIPPTFSNITHLQTISLGDNHLEGSIPEELGQLPDIFYVDLDGNRLSGRVPTSFYNRSNLRYLLLSENKLSGRVPASIGDLKNLLYLILGGNYFVGPIPYSIGNLSKLARLNLSNNQFESW